MACMASMEDALSLAGLGEAEAKVYLALLREGPCGAGAVIRASGMHRQLVYNALEALIDKGLVSCSLRNDVKFYEAAPPEKVSRKAAQRAKEILELLPKLGSIKPEPHAYRVKVYEGVEGFKRVMDDVLQEGKDFRVLGFTAKGPEIAAGWWNGWNRRRIRAGIRRIVVAADNVRTMADVRAPLTLARFLPPGYPAPASTVIYGKDKSLIFLPLEKKEFIGIIVESQEVQKGYRSYFDLLWKNASK